MRTRRLGIALAMAAATAWATASCAVIPVGGPFQIEEAGGGDPMSKPFQRMVAVRPQPNWSENDLVKGLQAAMAAYPDDPKVLPSYLTPEAQRTWKPGTAVTVIDKLDDITVVSVGGKDKEATATLKATPVAVITDQDQYVPMQSTEKKDFTFSLVKGPSGWRVKSMQQGLLLTQADVERAYRGTNLYYLNGSPGQAMSPDRLVVDRVWLRIRPAESFARTIVDRLLKGPTPALQGAVQNYFPDHFKIESITLDDRVVINLSGPFGIDDDKLAGLQAQLRFSLNNNQVANGRSIEIQLDGEPLSSSSPSSFNDWLDGGAAVLPYYSAGGALYALDGDLKHGTPIRGPAGQQNPDATGFAVSMGGDYVAARSTSRGGIWVTGTTDEGRWQQWFPGQDLTPPSWSRDGTLWTYDPHSASVLRCDASCANGARQPARVSAPNLVNADVKKLRIARDGVRVAALLGKSEVRVGALTNGDEMLGNVQPLIKAGPGEEILDLAWRDGVHLLVLVKGKGGRTVKEVNVGDGTTETVTLDNRLGSITASGDNVFGGTLDGKELLRLTREGKMDDPVNGTAPVFALG
ncbi:LpqB family beta-propeller domain-containing protein [Nonomuraea sediminis]|uniref:LpqB family beta-propeller domain-containing protein n=1 Tax=Nonomuraea sediminis TaxID=2835864 RepID=UPI001BDD483F|nr:LpqB family beta-propeller domain-containing protein [Nonomuraea sediminis]